MTTLFKAFPVALALAFAMPVVATSAFAQDAGATKAATDAATKAATKATTKATKKATTHKAATKKEKTATHSKSACKGLDEKSCGANSACGWVVPKKANDKTGKVQAAYCRKVAGIAKGKKAILKKAPAATTTAPAPAQ